MNIARALSGLTVLVLATACATQRSEQTAAPAASPSSEGVTSAPTLEQERASPPAAAAPAPQGLDQPKSAESARDEELTTLAAAERALNQAKADLDRLALAEPAPVLGHHAGGAEKKDARRAASSAAGASAPASAVPSAECENACRAFASLTRAASAVCRIDGENGTHCSRAKRVVSDSEKRVASCTCPPPGQ